MRFVRGLDYGPRRGTLGFAIHMAEGGDGTLPYLAKRTGETDQQWRTRVRGVSANFVILSTGETVQMVPWANASGSMNPSDRSDTAGYYQTRYIREVLGTHFTDPNAWSLSVEITGFRAQGPNRAQVEAVVQLIKEARRRYPQMVGAYGHADQTDTKGCPGTAPLMLEAWVRIGHGKFAPDEDDMDIYPVVGRQQARFPVGTPLMTSPTGREVVKVQNAEVFYDLVGKDKTDPDWYLLDHGGVNPMVWAKRSAILERRDITLPPAPQVYRVTVGGKSVGSVTLP
jgi:hypothetical protein